MTRILLTRPEPDNAELKTRLEQTGLEVLSAPMLVLKEMEIELPDITRYSAIVVTSKNAVRILAKNISTRDITIYTVGEQTALVAKNAGFQDVRTGAGDVAGLIELLKKESFDQSLLYLRGQNITLDLVNALKDRRVDEAVIYEMLENPVLPEEAQAIIEEGELDMLLLYSKRTAESFFKAIELSPSAEAIKMGLKRTTILCLGNSVLEYVSNKHEGLLSLIKEPSEAAILTLITDIKN